MIPGLRKEQILADLKPSASPIVGEHRLSQAEIDAFRDCIRDRHNARLILDWGAEALGRLAMGPFDTLESELAAYMVKIAARMGDYQRDLAADERELDRFEDRIRSLKERARAGEVQKLDERLTQLRDVRESIRQDRTELLRRAQMAQQALDQLASVMHQGALAAGQMEEQNG